MSDTEIAAIQTEAIRLYGLNPSVILSTVSTGGNLGTIYDTRKVAGAGLTSTTAYPSISTTPDVWVESIGYSKIDQSYDTSESLWNDTSYSYPLYYDAGNLREMSATDFADTFIYPAIDSLTSGAGTTAQAGTYFISTASSVAGATHVDLSSLPIFYDTRANASAFTASGLPEAVLQTTLINSYYLYRIDPATAAGHQLPICYTKTGTNLAQTPSTAFQTALQSMIRYFAAEVAGTTISYNINGAGNNLGTAMVDTRLSGSTYLTLYVNTNDYRAQEVPSGTATTINTYYLRTTQA